MGKRQRRRVRQGVAEFEVATVGCLDVLSIGKGDLRITIGDNPDDTEKARKLINEMLRKGYGIFVETDKGLTRVKRFNPKRMTYVITELVDDALEPVRPPGAGAKPAKRARRTRDHEVDVAGSKAVAVGRTGGG